MHHFIAFLEAFEVPVHNFIAFLESCAVTVHHSIVCLEASALTVHFGAFLEDCEMTLFFLFFYFSGKSVNHFISFIGCL